MGKLIEFENKRSKKVVDKITIENNDVQKQCFYNLMTYFQLQFKRGTFQQRTMLKELITIYQQAVEGNWLNDELRSQYLKQIEPYLLEEDSLPILLKQAQQMQTIYNLQNQVGGKQK